MHQRHSKDLDLSKKFDFSPSTSDGIYLYSKDGRKVLDFSNNFGINSFTNNFNIIENSIINQLLHGFLFQSSEFRSNVAEKLEDILCKLAGFSENCNKNDDNSEKKSMALFFNSISDANECAIKIARNRYNKLCERNYNEIIFFDGANHGNSIAMLSATQNNVNFEPRLSGFKSVIINDITSVEKQKNEHTCAVMLETVQYSNGIIACDKEFLQKLRKLCTKHEIMLILDETHCGCCRSGTFFAYEQYGILPDVVTISSGFCGGFPLSCCIVNSEMAKFAKSLNKTENDVIGNELFYNIADNIINEMSNQNFLNNIIKISQLFKTYLEELAEKYKNVIKSVNIFGLMISIEIEESIKNYRLANFFLSNGLMTKVANNGNVLLFFPPLNIDEKQIKEAINIISISIEEILIIERY